MSTVSITDQLKVLIELQALDGQIYRLRRELSRKPEEAAALKAQHQKAIQDASSAQDQYKALEVKRNQKEMELGEKESQIKKLQTQLFQVKTNKEYSALQKEIEGLKADKSVLEEEILKFMEEAEALKGKLQAEKESLKMREVSLNAEIARIDQETHSAHNAAEELQKTRAGLAPKMDRPTLNRYERILEKKEGLALVPVKGDACSGCNMVLPPQMINEIQMANRLIACESCARLLYIET